MILIISSLKKIVSLVKLVMYIPWFPGNTGYRKVAILLLYVLYSRKLYPGKVKIVSPDEDTKFVPWYVGAKRYP